MKCFSTLLAVFAFGSTLVAAGKWPNTVYLIRHGEKPDSGNGLTAQGQQRAQCLRNVFSASSGYNIGYILAQAYKSDGSRERPYLTVKPLADDLGLTVDTSCDRDDEDCVNSQVKAFTKTSSKNVLICWEHDELTKIASALGVSNPPDYPDNSFNIIWTDSNNKIVSKTSENCPGLDN